MSISRALTWITRTTPVGVKRIQPSFTTTAFSTRVPPPRSVPSSPAPEKPRGLLDGSGRVVSSVTPGQNSSQARVDAATAAASVGTDQRKAVSRRARKPPAMPVKDFIVDVTATTFQSLVLNAPVAVIVYFWAEWSEPCAALTSKLEAIVRSVPGVIRLAKVNVDSNAQLAAALKVAGVPTIIATLAGKSFGALPGPVPDAQLREFVQSLLAAADGAGMLPGGSGDRLQQAAEAVADAHEMVDAGEHEEVHTTLLPPVLVELKGARDRLAEQLAAASATDPQAAQMLAAAGTSGPLYELDDLIARALAALVRSLLASANDAGVGTDVNDLRLEMKSHVEELRTTYRAHGKQAEVHRALAAADLAEGAATAGSALDPLLAKVRASPSDPDLRFTLAEALQAAGQHAAAVDACLDILSTQGSSWGDGKAKALCLRIFEALGTGHPVVAAGRKRLSKLLFR